jgi:hypothetical protein
MKKEEYTLKGTGHALDLSKRDKRCTESQYPKIRAQTQARVVITLLKPEKTKNPYFPLRQIIVI